MKASRLDLGSVLGQQRQQTDCVDSFGQEAPSTRKTSSKARITLETTPYTKLRLLVVNMRSLEAVGDSNRV